jgi:hypothetical protein
VSIHVVHHKCGLNKNGRFHLRMPTGEMRRREDYTPDYIAGWEDQPLLALVVSVSFPVINTANCTGSAETPYQILSFTRDSIRNIVDVYVSGPLRECSTLTCEAKLYELRVDGDQSRILI